MYSVYISREVTNIYTRTYSNRIQKQAHTHTHKHSLKHSNTLLSGRRRHARAHVRSFLLSSWQKEAHSHTNIKTQQNRTANYIVALRDPHGSVRVQKCAVCVLVVGSVFVWSLLRASRDGCERDRSGFRTTMDDRANAGNERTVCGSCAIEEPVPAVKKHN